MENTDKIMAEFMGKDASEWYLAQGDDPIGPFKTPEIIQKLKRNEIHFGSFIWKEGMKEWMKLSETEPFKKLEPKAPLKKPPTLPKKAGPPKPPKTEASKNEWFLHYKDSQYGPFATGEVNDMLKMGKVNGRIYVWKDGMKNWEKIDEVSVFETEAKKAMKAFEDRKKKDRESPKAKKVELENNRRNAPRKPMVAKILLSNQRSVFTGICRDVSIGGMQVLTDQVPGPVGTFLKFNVTPLSSEKKSPQKPFVASGVIVRVLEDGRGFSFRFDGLTDEAQNIIEAFITSEE